MSELQEIQLKRFEDMTIGDCHFTRLCDQGGGPRMMATYLPTGEKRLIETHRSSVESGKKGALARAMVTVARAFEVSKPVEGPAE